MYIENGIKKKFKQQETNKNSKGFHVTIRKNVEHFCNTFKQNSTVFQAGSHAC